MSQATRTPLAPIDKAESSFTEDTIEMHPALTYSRSAKQLTVDIRFDKTSADRDITNFSTLIPTVSKYASYVQDLRISIHAPIPHLEKDHWQANKTRIINMLELVNEFNKFTKLKMVHAKVFMGTYNFPQMRLMAALHGLDFKNFTMECVTLASDNTTEEITAIERHMPVANRLLEVYRKEFLTARDRLGEKYENGRVWWL